jgi:putative SOS response-associated peptidase YedK
MCGRINVSDNEGVRALLESMGMETWPTREPRFNIAPTQTLDVVKLDNELVVTPMKWGVSTTLKNKNTGKSFDKPVFNARDDKLWSSYLWRNLVSDQRVLVPVNGFYEWRRENRKLVQTYYISPANHRAMFFAGLYRAPRDEKGKPEVSVITTTANDAMSPIHHRMPVILSPGNEAMAWIQAADKETLLSLMRPASNESIKITPVSNYVNKSSNEGPECIETVA